ncbi:MULTISPECIES: NnrU family protein [Rhizobium]|uniref:Putative membrane protein n=1 Tax=Rhizobium paranaense TaxID=1650438 RepID=A0A7W8XXW3_9HYPH|nr:NnrU family protein [Rhizobium paranaense]MBB5577586.1 putative membrane protein [Rhizobium paranaense]
MISFVSAFAFFLLLHSIPAIPVVRSSIVSRIGRPTYFVGYSAASVAALIWLFSAALALDYIPLWDLRPWHAAVTFVLAPLGGFLVIAGLLSANPLSIAIRQSDDVGAVVGITRHPVLWGFAIWASGHIVANGDLRSLLLFGGFALFSLGSIAITEKRARRRLGDRWKTLSKGTSIVPLAAFFSGRRPTCDLPMLLAALITVALGAWLLFAGGHALLFGADPIAVFG